MRLSSVVLLTCFVAASSLPGQSQGEYWKQCRTDDPEQSITACSALIQSGHLNGKYLTSASLDRGSAYARNGDYEHALQDYNAAPRLNANYADAFYGRGWVYAKKTDYDQAIQDFTHALRLNPSLSGALRERALPIRTRMITPARSTIMMRRWVSIPTTPLRSMIAAWHLRITTTSSTPFRNTVRR